MPSHAALHPQVRVGGVAWLIYGTVTAIGLVATAVVGLIKGADSTIAVLAVPITLLAAGAVGGLGLLRQSRWPRVMLMFTCIALPFCGFFSACAILMLSAAGPSPAALALVAWSAIGAALSLYTLIVVLPAAQLSEADRAAQQADQADGTTV